MIAFLQYMQSYSEEEVGLSKEDKARLERVMPKRMRPRFKGEQRFVLLPFTDQYGRLLYWDLTYTLPWGDIGEAGESGIPSVMAGNPVIRLTGEELLNKSGWTGRELWKKSDLPSEKLQKGLLHAYRTAMPSLAPGGYGYERLRKAFVGEKDYFGREESVPSAIASAIFGFKTISINPDDEEFFRYSEATDMLEEIMREARKISNSYNLNPKQKDEELRKLSAKHDRIIREFLGEEK